MFKWSLKIPPNQCVYIYSVAIIRAVKTNRMTAYNKFGLRMTILETQILTGH